MNYASLSKVYAVNFFFMEKDNDMNIYLHVTDPTNYLMKNVHIQESIYKFYWGTFDTKKLRKWQKNHEKSLYYFLKMN